MESREQQLVEQFKLDEEAPSVAVTVKELDALNAAIFDQRAKIAEMEDAVKEQNKLLGKMEAKAVAYLKELGRDKYQSPHGTISVVERWTWKLPSTPEKKAEFWGFLRERGLFDQMATINYQTLNAFANSEWEEAKKEGKGFEFTLPGLDEPGLHERLHVLKAREK